MTETEKQCKSCGETKPLTEYYYQSRKKNVKQTICKKCGNKQTNEWKKNNKERARNSSLKQFYGISLNDALKLLDVQKGKCAICRNKVEISIGKDRSSAYIDHCHSTNRVRGILCHSCNLVLGYSKDNPEILIRAAKYLDENN